jgi:hypothetical protein
MITGALQKRRPFQSREQVNIGCSQVNEYGEGSSVVTLLFAKKAWTKTDRCAGALS